MQQYINFRACLPYTGALIFVKLLYNTQQPDTRNSVVYTGSTHRIDND